jgi:hypothetical protein
MSPRSCALLVIAGFFAWLWTPAAEASLISTTVGSFGPTGVIHFAEFDPTLGTLDAVRVTISGGLMVQVSTAPNPLPPVDEPGPYSFSFRVEQDAIRGGTGRGFDFGLVPTQFSGAGASNPN